MFEKLSSALKKATDKIANAIFLDKNLVESIIKDLQRALIEADVNILLVKQLSDELRKAAFDERIKGLEKKEHLIKLLHDKLLEILGGKQHELKLEKGKAQKIMLLGLYGAGKTTTIAKLAVYYGKRGFKTCALGLDVHRPAAREQLEQLGQKNNLAVFINKQEKNPVKIWREFSNELKKYDLVLIDTAGRMYTNSSLLKEMEKIIRVSKPNLKLFIGEAITGNDATEQAKTFNEAVGIDGIILSKADVDEKGGASLSVSYVTGKPILFLGVGQEYKDLEEFDKEKLIKQLDL